RARTAVVERLAKPLGLDPIDAAWGIHAIVNENMAQAARTHLIERNRDPRSVAVVAFGGAGPAHAAEVARILGSRQGIVPMGAGGGSAVGALTAPRARPFVRSHMTLLDDCDWALVHALYDEMREEARRAFAATGNVEAARYRLAADMRFAGQYHELRVDLPEDALGPAGAREIEAAFREGYAATYGRAPSGLGIEVLNWHLIAELPRPAFTLAAEACHERDPRTALKGGRPVYFPRPEAGY